MRKLALAVLCLTFLAGFAFAQNKTIILVRHAEKNAPVEGDKGDVDLSSDGRDRALRFAKVAKRFRPGEIFATAYKRTQQTAEPIAKLRGKAIQIYDAAKHPELIDLILKSKSKRFVIVGHSNTVPFLANLLAKKEVFKQLPDTEYGVVWVIRITNGVFKKLEVYPY
ncbi:MAG: histidine phosphatase family protein [Pyrinomonadaceae bacterium]|nr:histidine phosphatase family protein [Acidobacteriota bacterium]MBK7933052.1 histidine phosphatase family protein [Acidobacteriota bacterium]MBP7375500.1 histidine phosphatase family protein [Pyrinomonadaceae bacterium]